MSRLTDILAEMVDMRRAGNLLCAEAATLHTRQVGQHVKTDRGDGVIVHVSASVERSGSHFALLIYEHVALLSIAGRPTKKRIIISKNVAEEWLGSSNDREQERRASNRNEGETA